MIKFKYLLSAHRSPDEIFGADVSKRYQIKTVITYPLEDLIAGRYGQVFLDDFLVAFGIAAVIRVLKIINLLNQLYMILRLLYP